MTEILKGLDSIDWKGLNAPVVPKWLRDLASEDREIRNKAFVALDTQVVNKGSTSWENFGPIEELLKTDVPCSIVPFFLELLESPDVESKSNILILLCDLGSNVQINIDKLDEGQRLRGDDLYKIIQNGLPIYKRLYETAIEPDLKQASLDLLNLFGEST